MKFAGSKGHAFIFELGKREKEVLLELLKLYPVIPSSHYRISKFGDARAERERQKLLDDALSEQRKENRRQLDALLQEEGRFKESGSGYLLHLSRAQLEWLFQVVNDIRVGSWIELGAPDEKTGRTLQLTAQKAHFLWAMELCGYLESVLLEAFRN